MANFFTDTDMMPLNDTWHPRMHNIVYYGVFGCLKGIVAFDCTYLRFLFDVACVVIGMDWLCPPYNKELHKRLQHYYGNITAENTIRGITPIVQTGDL